MLMRVPKATIRTQVSVPLRFADGYVTDARVFSFEGLVDGREHLTFGLGDVRGNDRIPLVRPHSECLTGDVFGSERCDCGPQLREAVERIAGSGGHLSNRIAAEVLSNTMHRTLEVVVLAHLSQECNSPECARDTVEPALRRRGFKGRLFVASQDEPLEAISLSTPVAAAQVELAFDWK